VRAVTNPLLFQFERTTVPNVVPDIFLVDQYLVNSATRPRTAQIGRQAPFVERSRNFLLYLATDESPIHPPHGINFLGWAGNKNDAVRLNALMLAFRQFAFRYSSLINQATPQPKSRWAALPEAKLNQPALTGKDLDRKLPAVLAGHRPFDTL